MTGVLPTSVRYIKNGEGGQWWKAARGNGQVHAGWTIIPDDLLLAPDWVEIKRLEDEHFGGKPGATQDINALKALLDRPSQHIWITFQDDCLWWCTVRDGVTTNPDGQSKDRGHFWLTCASPWSNQSQGDQRPLTYSRLPGTVTSTAGFKGTVCTPGAWDTILRIIRDDEDPEVKAATLARKDYQDAVAKLVQRLGPKDFEVLIDLILARTGWARLEKVGGVRADVDVEVQNAALDEVAFVQVKGKASQKTLNDSIERFNAQPGHYQRMIFAVHTPTGTLTPPSPDPVQVWTGDRLAQLVVNVGLGDWVTSRV